MTMSGRGARRGFLSLFLFAGTSGLLNKVSASLADRGTRPDDVADRLISLIADRQGAATIGQEYLRLRPTEARTEELLTLLGDIMTQAEAVTPRGDLGRILEDRRRSDFAQQRIVKLGGWILSETECRLCALAALARV